MKFRTRLGLTCLEARDVPDGTVMDPPSDTSTYTITVNEPGTGGGIDPGSGPIGSGDTWQAPPPPIDPPPPPPPPPMWPEMGY